MEHLLLTLEVPHAQTERRAGRREHSVQRHAAELEAVLRALDAPERRRHALPRHPSVHRQAAPDAEPELRPLAPPSVRLERVPVARVAVASVRRLCRFTRSASAAPPNRSGELFGRRRAHAAAELRAVLKQRRVVFL